MHLQGIYTVFFFLFCLFEAQGNSNVCIPVLSVVVFWRKATPRYIHRFHLPFPLCLCKPIGNSNVCVQFFLTPFLFVIGERHLQGMYSVIFCLFFFVCFGERQLQRMYTAFCFPILRERQLLSIYTVLYSFLVRLF